MITIMCALKLQPATCNLQSATCKLDIFAGIRVFPVKTEYVTDAPLMKLMMRYTSYSPKMTVII